MDAKRYRVRPATPDDAAAIAAVHVASWRQTYRGVLPDAVISAQSTDARRARWASMLDGGADDPAFGLVLGLHNDHVVGFGSTATQRNPGLRDAGFACEITALYVLENHHGTGLGAQLMSEMAINLVGSARLAAALWVLADNTRARRFYEKRGGEIVSERTQTRAGLTLREYAYGWSDLRALI